MQCSRCDLDYILLTLLWLDLADNLDHIYTIIVNTKFINILLVVVLCYGQLVVSMHAVGHLHPQEIESAFSDCHGETLNHHHSSNCVGHSDSLTHGFSGDHDRPGDADRDAETDCAIYHALLNLCGAMYAVQTDVISSLHQVAISRFSSTHPSGLQPGLQRIRAPPMFS